MSEVGRGLWTLSHPTALVKHWHYSRMSRVMSRWILNISKRDTPHPPWASCASVWSPSQEKSVSWCSKSEVLRPLLSPSSTLLLSQAFSLRRFRSFFSFSCLDLCIHLSLVLSFSAAGDCFVTDDLHLCPWRCSFPGVVLPCSHSSGLDQVLHIHCGGKTLIGSLQWTRVVP